MIVTMPAMEWLNYHHLLYFWSVARHGSITKASEVLNLAQPTLSGQIRTLERSLDEKLFRKSGRNLELTEIGQVVFSYADQIFSLGHELMDTLKARPTGKPIKLRVGIANVLPKLISHRLLEPALRLEQEVQLVCKEDKTERLLGDLAIHSLDLVLADAPLPPNTSVRAFNHLLGECNVTFFAAAKLQRRYAKRFPASLTGAPVLLPTDNTILRRELTSWFHNEDVHPRVVAEFEDSALMKVFGEHGAGIFPAPSLVEDEICKVYGVRVVGRSAKVKQRFYAISIERRIKHPVAAAISESARKHLFAQQPAGCP